MSKEKSELPVEDQNKANKKKNNILLYVLLVSLLFNISILSVIVLYKYTSVFNYLVANHYLEEVLPRLCDEKNVVSSEMKLWCENQIPAENGLSESCHMIKGPNNQDSCYFNEAVFNRDLSICDKIRNINHRDVCYTDFASFQGDLSICNNIEDKANCYLNVAISNGDLSICDKIEDVYHRDQCYSAVVPMEDEDR